MNFHANRDFAKDILSKSSQTLCEVYKIAQGHISVDEALQALYPRSDKISNNGRGDAQSGKDSRRFDRRKDKTGGGERDGTKRGKKKEYTPLNKPISTILKEIKDEPFFRYLEKLKAPPEKRSMANVTITTMTTVMTQMNVLP